MKEYVKLKDGKLIHPPKFYNNTINYDKNEKKLIEDDWKEYIVESTDLELPEGKEYYRYFEETDTTIISKFGVRDIVITPVVETVDTLKEQLEATDYKIIKCSEYQLAGEELPYDIVALHQERQALRNKINELEKVELSEVI